MLRLLIFVTTAVLFCHGNTISKPAKPVSPIVRPCHLYNLQCIRDNLAANSRCDRGVLGAVPEAYTMTNFRFETPYFNSSYIDDVVTITNQHKCYVSEFFFNTESDSGVLSVDCPYLGVAANRTMIQHRSRQEDTVYSYVILGVYPMIRMTTHFKHADHLDLCSAYVLAEVVQLPIFKINPNNQKTASYLSRDLNDLMIYERETFMYRGKPLYLKYVNSMLCDFKC